MKPITRLQREAIYKLYRRLCDSAQPKTVFEKQTWICSYRAFRKTVTREFYGDALMVHMFGMWIGIEPDGYTHT